MTDLTLLFAGLTAIPKHFEQVDPLKPNRSNMDAFWKESQMAIGFAVSTAMITPRLTGAEARFLIQKSLLKLVSPVEAIWIKTYLDSAEFPGGDEIGKPFQAFMAGFCKAFEAKFVQSFERVFGEWKVLRQTGSVPEFGDQVSSLGSLLKYSDMEKMSKFIDGLRSDRIRQVLRDRGDETFVKVLEAAIRLDESDAYHAVADRQLVSASMSGYMTCFNCRGFGHSASACPTPKGMRPPESVPGPRSDSRKDKWWKDHVCRRCNLKGHTERFCRKSSGRLVWCVSGIGLDHSSRASAREPAGMFPEFSF